MKIDTECWYALQRKVLFSSKKRIKKTGHLVLEKFGHPIEKSPLRKSI